MLKVPWGSLDKQVTTAMFPLARLCASSLLVLALAAFATCAMAEVSYPPGSRIGLEPPGDFKPSTRFPGFEDIDRKAAVTILELPASAYAELARAANATEQRGLTDVKREDFSFRGGSGLLVTGHGQINDVTLHKWILLANAGAEKDFTVLINVEVPESARAVYSDAVIRQALASVTFRPMPIHEQLGLLPFKLGQLAGFRVMQVLAQGGVILTEGPTDDLSKQPYVIVSVGQGSPEQPDDRARFARDLLSSAPLRDIMVLSADTMRIGGLPGYEIRAQAKGINDEPIMVGQWRGFSGGNVLGG